MEADPCVRPFLLSELRKEDPDIAEEVGHMVSQCLLRDTPTRSFWRPELHHRDLDPPPGIQRKVDASD